MRSIRLFPALAIVTALVASPGSASADERPQVRHVLLISVDGFHEFDLRQWITQHPSSTLAELTRDGTSYTHATTAKPSDSFPGLLAIVTGGTPRSTGVYYDDSYDRTLYAPPAQGGPTSCTGPAGTETQYAENIDTHAPSVANGQTGTRTLFETIDPQQLPQKGVNGHCVPVFPNEFLRTNTIFSVVHAAGLRTAWSDKHPAYQLVAGHGTPDAVTDLFTPEINADITPAQLVDTRGTTVVFPHPELGPTGNVRNCEAYDQIKVDAVLNEIDGLTSAGQPAAGVPAIFGMNFQSVSVGQKLVDSLQANNPAYVPGGYEPGTLAFTPQLEDALAFVDGALGEMVHELAAHGLFRSTELIISAKHGQSPIDPTLLHKIGHAETSVLTKAKIPVAQVTDDDVALIWLTHQAETAPAVEALTADQAGPNTARIASILSGSGLIAQFDDPLLDPRTPDIVVEPVPGTIYTKSGAKVAEHGGFAPDDTHVALLVIRGAVGTGKGNGKERREESHDGRTVDTPVTTAQIAPTILDALGLDPQALDAVRMEHTVVLPRRERKSRKAHKTTRTAT